MKRPCGFFPRFSCFEWGIVGISTFFLLFSILTWILYPIIYHSTLNQILPLAQNADKSLGYTAFLFSHPPSTNLIHFYLFNVTNPDEIVFYGAKPAIIEVGPFVAIESEEKKYLKWNEDGTQVFYENYKKYVLSQELSCDTCNWDRPLTFPNSPGLGAASAVLNPAFGITKIGVQIISLFLLLTGEYPFVTHPIRQYIFDGYDDPFLSAAHSDLMTVINGVFNGGKNLIPIPIPSMPRFGFFQGYNNSRDESYWVKTGKGNLDQLGIVTSWANRTVLPEYWWTTETARAINGTDSGGFAQMNLDKDSTMDFFFSFMCRSFKKSYFRDSTVSGIPTMDFTVSADQYDTTIHHGFRYQNPEKRNYFPSWPECPPRGACKESGVDCASSDNFCHACCDGSHVNNTYLLPPGMFPLVCYPGRLQPTPFNVFYSPPHYLYSPQQVVDSVYAMKPEFEKHNPWVYSHEPSTGTLVHLINRLQVNMPIVNNPDIITTTTTANVVIPLMWQETTVTLDDFVINKTWLGVVLVPKLVNVLKFTLLGLGLLLIVTLAYLRIRRRSTKTDSSIETPILTAASESTPTE